MPIVREFTCKDDMKLFWTVSVDTEALNVVNVVWRFVKVDVSWDVEIYPKVPRPMIVEVILVWLAVPPDWPIKGAIAV